MSALDHFKQEDGQLMIAEKSIRELTDKYGTPLYIYDRSLIKKRHDEVRASIPDKIRIFYAVKANPNMEIIRELGNLYDGLDIASKGEMVKSMESGILPEKMSFAGPGKGIDELHFAIREGIGTISVESERELEHINFLCQKLKKQVSVLIRVNPNFELAKSGMKMGGGPKQFGIDSECVQELIACLEGNENIRFAGIHIYAGSQNLNAQAILDAFQRIMDYAWQLSKAVNSTIRILNLGGGFGIPYFANDDSLDLMYFGDKLRKLYQQFSTLLPDTQCRIELGRFLVGECGIYITKVLYRKMSRNQVYLITDGGMHHHLAASGNFGQSLVRRPMAITALNRLNDTPERVNIVGPLCTPLDSFGTQVECPKADEGDLIGVMNSGAYGFSASPLGFLSHEIPKEILL